MEVTALLSLGAVALTGLISPVEALSGFSNPAVVTVMMMFILSASLVHSGLVTKLGYKIAEHTGMPLGTVKTQMRRGLMKVREMMEVEPLSEGSEA